VFDTRRAGGLCLSARLENHCWHFSRLEITACAELKTSSALSARVWMTSRKLFVAKSGKRFEREASPVCAAFRFQSALNHWETEDEIQGRAVPVSYPRQRRSLASLGGPGRRAFDLPVGIQGPTPEAGSGSNRKDWIWWWCREQILTANSLLRVHWEGGWQPT